jgi:hypothetical protein
VSLFKSHEPIQRLNLETPIVSAGPLTCSQPSPDKVEEIQRRLQQILKSGQTPERVCVCQVNGGLLTYQYTPERKQAVLLFTDPFAAQDYLRATNVAARVGQIKLETLPEMARNWVSAGVETFALNRCPRCTHLKLIKTTALKTKEDFVVYWAAERAARWLYGEILVLSASNHLQSGSHAKARADLEYVRDHLNCAIPYLHQVIGLIADVQQDEIARAAADERLKEFAPQFEGATKFSIDVFSAASVGLMMNFGMLAGLPGPVSPSGETHARKV